MPDYFHLVPQVRTFVELEEQNKGNLTYYGQPVPTYELLFVPCSEK